MELTEEVNYLYQKYGQILKALHYLLKENQTPTLCLP